MVTESDLHLMGRQCARMMNVSALLAKNAPGLHADHWMACIAAPMCSGGEEEAFEFISHFQIMSSTRVYKSHRNFEHHRTALIATENTTAPWLLEPCLLKTPRSPWLPRSPRFSSDLGLRLPV